MTEATTQVKRSDNAGLDTTEDNPPCYRDSPAVIASSLNRRGDAAELGATEENPPWYRDSPAAIASSLDKRGDTAGLGTTEENPPWYRDSPAVAASSLDKRGDAAGLGITEENPPWYRDSPAAVASALDKRADAAGLTTTEENPPWYRDSPAAVASALDKRADAAGLSTTEENPPWYRDSPAAVASALDKRTDAADHDTTDKTMDSIRARAFGNMRAESMRLSSEKGKEFFLFTPRPRNDTVDRWHIPVQLRSRYEKSNSDADRVSVLNNYLYVTGRRPKSAAALGFNPTMSMPGLPEGGNEVGYGYALEGQHQYHCADVVADAIDIGKDKTSDFFLEHVIHCVSLIKTLAMRLQEPQPVSVLSAYGEAQVKGHFKKTRP